MLNASTASTCQKRVRFPTDESLLQSQLNTVAANEGSLYDEEDAARADELQKSFEEYVNQSLSNSSRLAKTVCEQQQ